MRDKTRGIAVLGLGLLGGSLVRALRSRPAPPRLVGWTADGQDARAALAEGILDRAPAELADAVAGADLVVLAAPVGASIELLAAVAAAAEPDAVVTDVCSVKMPLRAAAERSGLADRFAGAHPMCGSHRSGWAAARADLYHGADVYLVAARDDRTTRRVEAFWRELGTSPVRIDAERHDALMARISHLPQLVASTLAAALAHGRIPRDALGPGGRDMTRLAAGDTALWSDILMHNRRFVLDAWSELDAELSAALAALEGEDREALSAVLSRGREWSGQQR